MIIYDNWICFMKGCAIACDSWIIIDEVGGVFFLINIWFQSETARIATCAHWMTQ